MGKNEMLWVLPVVPFVQDKNTTTIMFVSLCFTSLQQRGYLETAPPFTVPCEGMKLGKYTVPTGNQTQGRSVAVHYGTAAPCKLHIYYIYSILKGKAYAYSLKIFSTRKFCI